MPHSIKVVGDRLHVCSSNTGILHEYEFVDKSLREINRTQITDTHFLRGSYYISESEYYLGGSNMKEKKGKQTACIYHVKDGNVEERKIKGFHRIYDIVPWRDDVLNAVVYKYFD